MLKRLLLLLFLFSSLSFSLVAQVNVQDSMALVAFYQSTNGDEWINNDNWLEGPVESWYGVKIENERVIEVDLPLNNLNGTLPSQLEELTQLKSLELSDNLISGVIPNGLGSLTALVTLDVSSNQLSGFIPTQIGDASNLQVLNLFGNRFTGFIPSEIGKLSDLRILNLIGSSLEGTIPESFENLIYLEELKVNFNELTGEIPDYFSSFSNLKYLGLSFNQFSGSIPSSLGQLSQLEFIEANNNEFEGSIPKELASLGKLRFLYLSRNNLSGNIPQEIGQLSRLQILLLNDNRLTGEIPIELGNLVSAESIDISRNEISGELPSNIGQISRLGSLYINDNNLYGSIPIEFTFLNNLGGDQFSSLNYSNTNICEPPDERWVDWSVGRNIVGSDIVCSAVDMYSFKIVGYEQFGKIDLENRTVQLRLPDADFSSLIASFEVSDGTIIEVDGVIQESGLTINDFSAPVVYNLTATDNGQGAEWTILLTNDSIINGVEETDYHALVSLYESTNGANWTDNTNWLSEAPVEDWVGVKVVNQRVSSLELGSVSINGVCCGNNLGGRIPSEIGDLSALKVLDLGLNEINGEIPEEIGQIKSLERLLLGWNKLSGEIPASITSLSLLTELNLSSNNLSGEIPADIGQLKNLSDLKLADNQLIGEIPDELGSLQRLLVLDLSKNQLAGDIPSKLSELGNLVGLSLNDNNLSGSMPIELYSMPSLISLDLSNNQLIGPLRSEVGKLTSLFSLDVSGNFISGHLPSTIGNLTDLEILNVNNTNLEGSIPISITSLQELASEPYDSYTFNFSNTRLCEPEDLAYNDWKSARNLVSSGLICNEKLYLMFDSIALVTFYESTDGNNWTNNGSWMEGPVESWYGVTVEDARVTQLKLNKPDEDGAFGEGNNLNGNLPSSIGELTSLKYLDLSFNELNGPVPTEVGNLYTLEFLDLTQNELTGELPAEIGRLVNLEDVQLSYNGLEGAVPMSFVDLHKLQSLSLSNNAFVDLPDLSLLPLIDGFDLTNNFFTFEDLEPNRFKTDTYSQKKFGTVDTVTAVVGQGVFLTQGAIGGSVNSYTWARDSSVYFDSDSYEIAFEELVFADQGTYTLTVENELFPGFKLESEGIFLDLGKEKFLEEQREALVTFYHSTNGPQWTQSSNWLSEEDVSLWNGVIVTEVGIVVGLDLDDNNLSGSLSSELAVLDSLQFVSLFDNSIGGTLPIELGLLTGLERLDISKNNVVGEIPREIGNLKSLRHLDLSRNNLIGSIPVEFAQLTYMDDLNLSENQLTGVIPASFTDLSQLGLNGVFNYSGNTICEPSSSQYQEWKNDRNIVGTNLICSLTDFYIFKMVGYDEIPLIDRENYIITFYSIDQSVLVAEFDVPVGTTVYVEDTPQESCITPNDFSTPVTYTLNSQDGTERDWTIIVVSAITGVAEDAFRDISIYPNPAQHLLHIEDAQNRIKNIQLLNLTGQLTRTFEANLSGQYDISTLTNGMYMMRIELEDNQFVHAKVVIRH